MKLEPNLVRSALITLLYAAGPDESHCRPQAFGYSQSMSIPSKTSDQRESLTRL